MYRPPDHPRWRFGIIRWTVDVSAKDINYTIGRFLSFTLGTLLAPQLILIGGNTLLTLLRACLRIRHKKNRGQYLWVKDQISQGVFNDGCCRVTVT